MTYEFTSQIFFEESVNDAVMVRSPYSSRGAPTTRNSSDNIYGSDGSQLTATVTPDGSGGYAATFNVGVTGLASGAATTTTTDTTVSASLTGTKLSRSSSGTRVLTVTLNATEAVSADVRLLRGSRLLARKRLASGSGTRRAALTIPRAVAAGGARLSVALTDARANQKVVQRAVSLPRR